jgi:hypothetical protein
MYQKMHKDYKDSKSVLFSLALIIVEFLAFLWFFTNLKLQNISEPLLQPGASVIKLFFVCE